GNGAPLASMLWGCIAIFAIINKPLRGAVAAAVRALLPLFRVIQAPVVGFAEGSSLMFVTAYLMMGGMVVVNHVLDFSVTPPLPGGEGRGEGTRTHLQKDTK
ncbi:xanthine permease, partial [Enterobacter asburiae]